MISSNVLKNVFVISQSSSDYLRVLGDQTYSLNYIDEVFEDEDDDNWIQF